MVELPADPLRRFISIYEALNAERGWWSDASCLRFTAVTAITCPGEAGEVAQAIRRAAGELKKRVGWFEDLSSELRFIMSAILVLENDDPGEFLEETKRVRKLFRSVDLRRGGIYETMAILILRMDAGRMPLPLSTVERLQAIYSEMKRHHWWLTGPEDFPVCAILVRGKESAQEIGERIELIHRALLDQGFSSSDPLQTAANILFLARREPELLARRFHDLAQGFREGGVSIWKSDYDELAILSFLEETAERVVERVLQVRKEMEALHPKPNRSLTFNLAASIAFLEILRGGSPVKGLLDAKSLLDMQAILNAQHAAAIAATTAATTH